MSIESQSVEFIPLINHDDFEISTTYPFTIRDNHCEISEFTDNIAVNLNNNLYRKHRLIGLQFKPNPYNLPCVDHINRIKTDNRFINLRWVSARDNGKTIASRNGIQYNFINEISDETIVVNEYNNNTFENYYYDGTTDRFYFLNEHQYREIHINEKRINHS